MSALLEPVTATGGIWSIGTPRLLAGLERHDCLDAAAHLAVHGPRPRVELARLIEWLDGARLAGRGGAGFPLAAKLRALPAGRQARSRVVVNGSESEPASHKDRTLLRRSPHLVLDGALTVAQALGTHDVTVAVHDAAAHDALRDAAASRPDANGVHVVAVGGGFVAGEARALVRALGGGPAVPPGRRTPPTADGVLVANAETFAQTALLIRRGVRGFAATGTRDEPGTTLLTIGGAVGRPGVVEVPLGTPLHILLAAAQAADPALLVVGGYHGSWLVPHPDIALSRVGLAAAGASFGAGVLLVLDTATCPLGELAAVAGWLAGQSARQCGPCRFGLPALAADLGALAGGHPDALGRALAHARSVDGRGACTHPDGAARFVGSGLRVLADEIATHRSGGCHRPVLGRLPIGGRR